MSIYDTPEYKERWAMYQSALDAGIPIVSTETCAIICAMLPGWQASRGAQIENYVARHFPMMGISKAAAEEIERIK